jgi:hypothetical protein
MALVALSNQKFVGCYAAITGKELKLKKLG